jgi:hypothetical protein
MARGVGDRGHCGRVVAKEREGLDLRVLNHGVEVAEHRVQAEVVDVALGAAGAAAVVENQAQILSEPLICVAEPRDPPLPEDVAQGDRWQPYQHRPFARHGVGDGHSVAGARVPEARLHAVLRAWAYKNDRSRTADPSG